MQLSSKDWDSLFKRAIQERHPTTCTNRFNRLVDLLIAEARQHGRNSIESRVCQLKCFLYGRDFRKLRRILRTMSRLGPLGSDLVFDLWLFYVHVSHPNEGTGRYGGLSALQRWELQGDALVAIQCVARDEEWCNEHLRDWLSHGLLNDERLFFSTLWSIQRLGSNHIGIEETRSDLFDALSDERPRIRNAAANALARISSMSESMAYYQSNLLPDMFCKKPDPRHLFGLFFNNDFFVRLAHASVGNGLRTCGLESESPDGFLSAALDRFFRKLESDPTLGTTSDNVDNMENRLRRILRNATIDEVRRWTRYRNKTKTEYNLAACEKATANVHADASQLEIEELYQLAITAAARKGAKYVDVVRLHIQGCSVSEIADHLDINPNTASKRLQRILPTLREVFKPLVD